jgi:hypothetical protein
LRRWLPYEHRIAQRCKSRRVKETLKKATITVILGIITFLALATLIVGVFPEANTETPAARKKHFKHMVHC